MTLEERYEERSRDWDAAGALAALGDDGHALCEALEEGYDECSCDWDAVEALAALGDDGCAPCEALEEGCEPHCDKRSRDWDALEAAPAPKRVCQVDNFAGRSAFLFKRLGQKFLQVNEAVNEAENECPSCPLGTQRSCMR